MEVRTHYLQYERGGSNYAKCRPAKLGTTDEKIMPLYAAIAKLFAPLGLIVILQLYDGKGILATSIHEDGHEDGAHKLLIRVEGAIAFYAAFLSGTIQLFHSIDCDSKISILRGAHDTLGLERPLGEVISHAGVKQAGRPSLLLQLRPDGRKWALEKPFSDEDCLVILKRFEDFVLEKTGNVALAAGIQKAVDKNVLGAAASQSSVRDLVCKILQPMFFNQQTSCGNRGAASPQAHVCRRVSHVQQGQVRSTPSRSPQGVGGFVLASRGNLQ